MKLDEHKLFASRRHYAGEWRENAIFRPQLTYVLRLILLLLLLLLFTSQSNLIEQCAKCLYHI